MALNDADHQKFLRKDSLRQLEFFNQSLRSDGGFDTLNYDGSPLPYHRQALHTTTRLIHSFALGKQLGFDGDALIDAGMKALWDWHRDQDHGGFFQCVKGNNAVNPIKMAYGHAFILLAASSAYQIDHPDAMRLLDTVHSVIDTHYWDEDRGLMREEFNQDWTIFSAYRGMNANMHSIEAMLAAFNATGREVYLQRAGKIIDFFVNKIAPIYNWRIPEHYDEAWHVTLDYDGDPVFRPRGSTPGHSFELGRLLIEYWDLSGRKDEQHLLNARNLIDAALKDGWLKEGGFVYTLNPQTGKADRPHRYWWPVTEAIGAIATLLKIDPTPQDELWYRRLWTFSDEYLIDHKQGGWFPELDDTGNPHAMQFHGKPDIYHSLQANLISMRKQISLW